MSVGYRDESDAQLLGNDRGPVGGADIPVTRVASSNTTTAPCPECQFGAVSTVTQRTGTAVQNGPFHAEGQQWSRCATPPRSGG